jgi:DNA-directed RNA polymerase beta' subunit
MFKSSIPTKSIKSIQFGILSNEEKKKITNNIIITDFSGYEFGKYREGTLYDKKMGTIFEGNCSTCNLSSIKCPGHPGLIEFPKAMIHPEYINLCIKILNCMCFRCGYFLVKPKSYKKILSLPKEKRLKLCKLNISSKCAVCSFENKNIKYSEYNSYIINYKYKNEIKQLDAEYIYEKLKLLKNSDINLLGFTNISHPKSMILFSLICMPPIARPVIQPEFGTGAKNESNFYKSYKNIIKSLNKLKKIKSTDKHEKEYYDEFSMNVSSFLSSKGSRRGEYTLKSMGIKKKQQKSVMEKLSGKDGIWRNNISGRRVNFSGRSVINGDASLKLNEIGIPIEFALKLCKLIRINKYNITDVKKWIINGPKKWPGAILIIKKNGLRKSLFHSKDKTILINEIIKNIEYGDKIYRHLHNGDYILFNRQPTLHKPSIMAHKVKIKPEQKTLSLNTCVTVPYNADFDGDEMNTHGIYSDSAVSEAKFLLSVEHNQIDTISSNVIIAPIQDNILGGYLMTKNKSFKLSKDKFLDIVFSYKDIDINKIPNKKEYTPIDCLNITFPNEFYFKNGSVEILNSKWISGILNKSILKKIIKSIIQNFDVEIALEFSYSYQQITNRFLMLYGITISINDCIIDEESKKQILKNKEELFLKNIKLLKDFDDDKIILPATKNAYETYEIIVSNLLSENNKKNHEILEKYFKKKYNNFHVIIQSGAKGTQDNLIQIFAGVGQQKIEGSRIKRDCNKRTIPFTTKYDESLKFRGFVNNSFVDGLDPIEFYMHANGGREGVINTTLKTSITGYVMKQAVKAQESIIISHDNIVRHGNENIVSYTYGPDHMNPKYLFKNNLWLKDKNFKWVDENFH